MKLICPTESPGRIMPVFVLFPAGSPATQTVTVSATNFNSTVPLRAVVTPQSCSTTGTVNVQISAGVARWVEVWMR